MLELLAAIQGIDPFAAMLWSLFVFAAGMYPVGIMLGSQCSPCCSPCPCPAGTLPDTLTVTFKGLPDQTRGSDILGLSFSSCFGSGAAGRILEPGGVAGTDDGPISSVSLTNAGSGYAKLGRVAPTLTASGSGTGAEFTLTVTQAQDACSVDYWKVTGITKTKAGSGYTDGEAVVFTVATGDTEEVAASATISTVRTQPTLTASVEAGSGAVFAVTTTANGTTPETWSITSISVTSGGTGYADYSLLAFTLEATGVELSPAYVYARTGRVQPTLTADISSVAGIGATFTPVLTKATDYFGRDVWNITGLTITNAGLGYAVEDQIQVAVQDGQASYYSYFYAYVLTVDENGAVLTIQIDYGGEYFKDNGIIESTEISSGGSFYNNTGAVSAVTLSGGGIYYREDASAPPYVAAVTVSISQNYPSVGSGGQITATVDDDPESATFGKLSALSISEAGDDYLAWEWKNTKCCGWYWDDKPVVVRKNSIAAPYPCELTFASCFGSGAAGKVTAPGATVWDAPGPIESVNLANGGFGYARLGRSAPTITPASTNYYDGGATFSVSLDENKDSCGLPWWSVKSVGVDNSGIGYQNGAELTLWGTGFRTLGKGIISIGASQPTLAATPNGTGSGASLSVTTSAPLGTTPETWSISGISVTAGGSGYTDGSSVSISGTGVKVVASAVAAIRTSRVQPALTASLQGAGAGASLVPVLTAPITDSSGRTAWGVAGFTINNPGSGYEYHQFISVSSGGINFGAQNNYFGRVSAVDPSGGITAAEVVRPGVFAEDGGVIELVSVSSDGAYYKDDGIASVAVTNPGIYYVEDPELPPYVADVTVGFSAFCPGSGGIITPTIETNTSSGNFGTITALTVTNAGDGYEAGDGLTNYQLENPRCRYIHRMCGGWQNLGDPGAVEVLYYGPTLPPKVFIDTEGFFRISSDIQTATRCDTVFVADKALSDCSNWTGLTFTSESGNGATATVESGGEYDILYKRRTPSRAGGIYTAFGGCDQCCQGEEEPPVEITVTLEHNRYGNTSLSGDYVLTRGNNLGWFYGSSSVGITLQMISGRCDDADVSACDNCIKKCEAVARVQFAGGEDTDMRNCSSYEPGLSPEEQSIAACEAFCTEDTPTCNPSGLTFSFLDPLGSENRFDPTKNICDENTDLVNYPNHLNTFTLSVQ